ncbi:hypothetical protein BSKO_12078 [Bryopsis sp. KO-2023]|nr:hypothetical protein BSKO_12078 [Bryopsis sp. KO-2023]
MLSASNINEAHDVDEAFDSEATQSAGEAEALGATARYHEVSSRRSIDLVENGLSTKALRVRKNGASTSAQGLCSASELNAATDTAKGVSSVKRGGGLTGPAGKVAKVNDTTSETDLVAESWRWELKLVEVERSFGHAPLILRKWVRVACKTPRPKPKKHLTIETARDGTQILVGGFMKYHCSHGGCGKVFATMGSLRKHMHIHEEKQFLCQYPDCGKRFIDRSKLKRHMGTHNKAPRLQKKAKK